MATFESCERRVWGYDPQLGILSTHSCYIHMIVYIYIHILFIYLFDYLFRGRDVHACIHVIHIYECLYIYSYFVNTFYIPILTIHICIYMCVCTIAERKGVCSLKELKLTGLWFLMTVSCGLR